MRFYDRDGVEVSLDEWLVLRRDYDRCLVARIRVRDALVSTMWFGLDLVPHAPEPHIFETLVIFDDQPPIRRTWATEADAIDGHTRLVDWLCFQPDSA